MTPFGKRLKELREKNGLTLEELGKKIDSSKSYIWELENKPSIRPSVETANKLAIALSTTVSALMGEPEIDELPHNQQVFFREYQGLSESDQETVETLVSALRKKRAEE